MTKHITTIIIFFLGTTLLFPQQTDAEQDLTKRVTENHKIVYTDPEKSFAEAQSIEKEARKLNAKSQELDAIDMQCTYYGAVKDFEKLLATGKALYQKAGRYKMPLFQVRAKRHTFEAYVFTGLPDKAFQELEQGRKIISKLDENDPVVIAEKIRLFSSYANYYWSQGDVQTQLKYTLLTGKEIKKIPDEKQREHSLFIQYSNIAATYSQLNLRDSAKVYAELSQSMYEEQGRNRKDVLAENLLTLGKVAQHEKDYQKAISYLKQAEKLEGYKNHLNHNRLYNLIIETYGSLQQEDSVKIYQIKRDSLKLAVAENQKKSLTTLVNEKEESNPVYKYVFGSVLVVMGIFTFFVVRKNRMLTRQEKASKEYLEKIAENPSGEDYSQLLKALQEKDPAFMFYFEEMFPDFASKTLQINPKISASDIEFCALLKIKIPTKDIARYKFIAPKTVLNKKHLIRQKLNIPKGTDIYQWFDRF